LDGQGGVGRLKWAVKALLMPVSALIHAPRVLRHGDLTVTEKATGLGTLARVRLLRMAWMLSQAVTGQP